MANNYIICNENALFYECGYSCDNAIFLSLNGANFFITDARYVIEALETIKNAEVIDAKGSLIAKARGLLRAHKIQNLIFDPQDFSYGNFMNLSEFLHINFIPKPNFSKQKRVIKSQNEIEILRTAAKFGRESFDKFAKVLKEGMSEKELFFEAERIFKDGGNLELSFNPIIAINQNAAKAHALPSDMRVKSGDLVLLDAGVRYKKYCSDRTRTAFFEGDLNFTKEQNFQNSKQQEIYEIVKEAQNLAIKAIKPGVRASDIDKAARDFIAKAGFGEQFFHSTGHGVGIDIHELPNINPKDSTTLKKGMVFSVEPGIYLRGEFGVRIEDVIVVSDEGCEIL